MHRLLLTVLAVVAVSGCATTPRNPLSPELGAAGAAGACAQFFAELDAATKSAGVRDAGSFRIAGFPYLRVDRFLASFHDDRLTSGQFETWVDHMQRLDREARQAEVANLPAAVRARFGSTAEVLAEVERCAEVLRRAELSRPERRQALRALAFPQDEYSQLGRALGLYPVSRYAVLIGVERWQARARARHRAQAPAVDWGTRYSPPDAARPAAQWRQDALGVPLLDAEQAAGLLRWYAPVIAVAEAGEADRLGRPVWGQDGPAVVPEPVVYTLISYTRWQGQVLPQLNYIIWFDARPAAGPLDLLAGRLDGLTLRITLDQHGQPLLVDSMHNCGCYHRFFPLSGLRPRAEPDYMEPPLVLPAPDWAPASQRLVLGLEAGSHYLVRLGVQPRRGARKPYRLRDYQALRSLPAKDGRRSLFAEDGIVAGTERLERWVFWPTGVPEPGAMRQWGRHVTGFVGRRHFDDPHLIGRIFRPAGLSQQADRSRRE